MKQAFCLLLCLLLAGLIPSAFAEDVFTVDAAVCTAASEFSLSTDRSYLRVNCYLEEEVPVLLSVTNASGRPVYQRDYDQCSGNFHSEDIFLPLDSAPTTYEVTLHAGEDVYEFPLQRLMPRVSGAAGCSAGYALSNLSGLNSWQTATLLDIAALDGSSLTVPLWASNSYEMGEVTFSLNGDQLTVSVSLAEEIDGAIDKGVVYAAVTALEAQSLGRKNFSGAKGKLNQAISLNGAAYAAVYVQLTLSYDPANLPAVPLTELSGQEDLWQHMLDETINEAVG